MEKVYIATKLICDTYTEQIKNVSKPVERWILHKVKHTFQVAHEIMNIMFHEKNIYESFSKEDKELAELSAVLHDLGRLYQHNKEQVLSSDKFEHGEATVNILKKNQLFNNPILLFAVGEHNHYTINYENPYYTGLNEQDKKKAEIIAKLLRDADKLDNIRHMIYTYDHNTAKNAPKGEISEYIKSFLREHKAVNYTKCPIKKENFMASEYLASYLSWVNDIYFEHTKEIIRDVGFVEFCISKMKDLGGSEEDIEFLNKYLKI